MRSKLKKIRILPSRLKHLIIIITQWLLRCINHSIRFPLDSYRADSHLRHHRMSILHDNINDKKKPYLCIFSQFDTDGNIPGYCAYYLKQLQAAGCDIILVSTSPSFSQQAIATANLYCKTILHRSNIGHDIYSYKLGLQHAANDLADYDKVIIANDSVYGPFYDLEPLLTYGDQHGLDVWGASDSHQICYHMQTYFVVFNKSVVASSAFTSWWDNVQTLAIKQHIIDRYELKMAQCFIDAGFNCGAYYSGQLKSNPTILLWDKMISQHQFPFLKKEAVKLQSQGKIKVHADYAGLINNISQYDVSLINV
ncbi:MAG: rhamnan synthesis F family protein [Coxiellaceae bacterium]|nr:rhamnan synthesis F family protein [Coxiellaceae bacterium]